MKIQILSRLPSSVDKDDIPGPLVRILQNHLGLITPQSFIMPGTRVYAGWRVIHFAINSTPADTKWLFDAINDAGVLDWRIEAAQDFKLRHQYDEEGNIISTTGVHIPVPQAMVNWLDDIVLYDGEGNPIGTERPPVGSPMHIYSGADQWVWAE